MEDIGDLDTSNVTNMSYMFDGSIELTTLVIMCQIQSPLN